MAEYFPGAPIESSGDDDKDKDGKKKSKKRANAAGFAAPILQGGEVESPKAKEAPRWDLLGNLVVSGGESTSADAKASDGPEKPAKDAPKAKESSKKPAQFEQLPEYHPTPVEFSGGEVIVSLRGVRTIAEREVPLDTATEQTNAESSTAETQEQAAESTPPSSEPPMWRMQPEQQHQARFEDTPEPGPEPGGGEIPPIDPPEVPPTTEWPAEEPPEVPRRVSVDPNRTAEPAGSWHPAESWRRAMRRQQQLTRVEADTIETHARRSGVRNFLTGLFTGAVYEHIIHKKQEKRVQEEAKRNRAEVKKAREDLRFSGQEQERRQAEADLRFAAAEQRYASAEKRLEGREKHLEDRVRLAEHAAAQVAQTEQELLKAAPENQIQMSAWLATEVNKRTGQVVEKPSFEYGQEYHRERAHELTPPDQRSAVAGGVALIGAAGSLHDAQGPGGDGSATGMPGNIPSATTRRSTRNSSQSVYGDSDNDDKSTALLWPWVIVLLVVAISLVVALT